MTDRLLPAISVAWPVFTDIAAVKTDNVTAMIERADTLLKAQDDGLKAMEARMSSLFGQSVTLATAAVAATATAFAAGVAGQGAPGAPIWAQPWVAPSLAILSGLWLVAVLVAAMSMRGRIWRSAGLEPRDLYGVELLCAPPDSLQLAIARALQEAIDLNAELTAGYTRRLAWVIWLLASGPLIGAACALWLTHPEARPHVAALLAIGALATLLAYPRRNAESARL